MSGCPVEQVNECEADEAKARESWTSSTSSIYGDKRNKMKKNDGVGETSQ